MYPAENPYIIFLLAKNSITIKESPTPSNKQQSSNCWFYSQSLQVQTYLSECIVAMALKYVQLLPIIKTHDPFAYPMDIVHPIQANITVSHHVGLNLLLQNNCACK
jgi:hypothetical protein